MMNKMIKLVAGAGFVFATFAGAQSASAQSCYAPRDVLSTDSLSWRCGNIRANIETGLTDATVSTTVLALVGIPHEIHIQLDCAHETYAENGEAFSINDNSDYVSCPNDEILQHAVAWVDVNPSSGGGQGGADGEGEDGDQGGDESGDQGGDEGGDQGGDEGDEGGE